MSISMCMKCLPPVIVLLLSKNFASPALLNCIIQLVVFTVTAQIPAFLTNRMSYVDIAWPWGLVSIGLIPTLSSVEKSGLRANLIMTAYILAGFRMGLGALIFFFNGKLKEEFPRYIYQRKMWAKMGIKDDGGLGFKITMQIEIFVQCLCNMGYLCMPLMIQAFGYKKDEISNIEIFGWVLWLLSLGFEHAADKQKKQFIRTCQKNKIKNAVCDVGLWQYCRHPNYFGEWMVWNSLIITSIPSLIALWQTPEESPIIKIAFTYGLVNVSRMMYHCLVHYTGAAPAEYYSVQKRPDYLTYQKTVNMFFPGPRRKEYTE